MRQQTGATAQWPAFHITGETAKKLKKISHATIDRYLKKDREALKLKGKSLTKPLLSLKSRIPTRLLFRGIAENARFPANRRGRTSVRHYCGQVTSDQHILTLTATDVASGWMRLYSLLNKVPAGILPVPLGHQKLRPGSSFGVSPETPFPCDTVANSSTTPPK
jgi:hypothetical protein